MEDDEKTIKSTVNRGRRMDFAPRNARATAVPYRRKSPEEMTEAEKARRERARKEVARREEIHRQIEAQKEADIIARRRAIAARKDLARRLEVEEKENAEALAEHERELREAQEREERAQRKAQIEQRALRERQRLLAARRAQAAKKELLRRRQEEGELRVPVKRIDRAVGSTDPLLEEDEKRAFFKRTRVAQRLGSVEDFENELNDLEIAAEEVLEEKEDESIKEFVEDRKEDDLFDDIDRLDAEIEKKEEDTSDNNSRYVLGGRSPFINTEVEKRPLSGGAKSLQSTAAAAGVPMDGKTRARGRFVPYNEPLPHKNIYARSLAKEKKKGKEVPTMVVGDTSKGSSASLIVAIILTVALGAVVGTIAYLAFFQ